MTTMMGDRAGGSMALTVGAFNAAVASDVPDQYLTFMLGGETFALGILTIKEIIEYRSLTELPMMPASVRGVINLRGAVVPVVDLQARFGRVSSPVGKRTCIVIVEVGASDCRRVVGLVVDAVNAVLEIGAAQIEPAPAFGARIETGFIQGMGKVDDGFVIVLNAQSLLSQVRIDSLSGVDPAALEAG